MKASTLLIAAAAAGGLFYFIRKAKAEPLGAVAPDGSGSTVVRGQVTGQIYPVGIGAAGPGGSLYSVFSPVDPSVLLFVYVDEPSSEGAQVPRAIVRRNAETDAAAVDAALNDFGFPVER